MDSFGPSAQPGAVKRGGAARLRRHIVLVVWLFASGGDHAAGSSTGDDVPDTIATRIAQAQDAVRRAPASGRAQFELGLAYWDRGNLVGARSAFEQAMDHGVSTPDSAQAMLVLAEIALRQGRIQSARTMLEAIWERGNATPDILRLLAQMRWDDHRREDALVLAMESTARDPFDVDGLRWLSDRWKDVGRPELALAARERIRRLGAAGSEDLFQIAFLAQQTGDQQKAVDGYTELLATEARHAEGNYNLSLMLLQAGDTLEAIRHLERSIAGLPKLAPAFMDLALLYLDRNQTRDARRVLRLLKDSGEADSLASAEIQSIIDSLPDEGPNQGREGRRGSR